MLVYKDLFTDDEIISDSYPQRPVLNGEDEVPGLFEVDSRIVAVGGDNIDIGCGSEFGGGDVDVAVDDSIEKENNIISERAGFGYTEMPMSKAEFKDFLKEYMKKIRQHMKTSGAEVESIKKFMEDASIIAKFLLGKYSDLQFYMGRSMNPEAGLAFAYYKEGALAPTFMYILYGLKQEKF